MPEPACSFGNVRHSLVGCQTLARIVTKCRSKVQTGDSSLRASRIFPAQPAKHQGVSLAQYRESNQNRDVPAHNDLKLPLWPVVVLV